MVTEPGFPLGPDPQALSGTALKSMSAVPNYGPELGAAKTVSRKMFATIAKVSAGFLPQQSSAIKSFRKFETVLILVADQNTGC